MSDKRNQKLITFFEGLNCSEKRRLVNELANIRDKNAPESRVSISTGSDVTHFLSSKKSLPKPKTHK